MKLSTFSSVVFPCQKSTSWIEYFHCHALALSYNDAKPPKSVAPYLHCDPLPEIHVWWLWHHLSLPVLLLISGLFALFPLFPVHTAHKNWDWIIAHWKIWNTFPHILQSNYCSFVLFSHRQLLVGSIFTVCAYTDTQYCNVIGFLLGPIITICLCVSPFINLTWLVWYQGQSLLKHLCVHISISSSVFFLIP